MSRKSYAVLGLGKFGNNLALELAKTGADVLVVDNNEEKVRRIADEVTYAVKADICDTETLSTLGLSNMDGVIVAVTKNLDASIMGTIFSKEQGVPLVIAKARDEVHSKILTKVGVDKVILPEKEASIRVAKTLMQDEDGI